LLPADAEPVHPAQSAQPTQLPFKNDDALHFNDLSGTLLQKSEQGFAVVDGLLVVVMLVVLFVVVDPV